jgi:hypothetical protein
VERTDYYSSALLQGVLPREKIERPHHRRMLALKFVFDVILVHQSNHAKSSPMAKRNRMPWLKAKTTSRICI